MPKKRIIQSFNRVAHQFDQQAVLIREIADRLLSCLEYIKLSPKNILDLGSATGYCANQLLVRFPQAHIYRCDLSFEMLRTHADPAYTVCTDAHALPFSNGAFDFVISNAMLPWSENLKTLFLELKRVLKPGGLFLFTSFGPNTLQELKTTWAQIDPYDHVNTFYDMHEVGDLLLETGFSDPVMNMEMIQVQYRRPKDLLNELKNLGSFIQADHQRPGLTSVATIQRVLETYPYLKDRPCIHASCEIIYGHAWAPEISSTHTADETGVVRIPIKAL